MMIKNKKTKQDSNLVLLGNEDPREGFCPKCLILCSALMPTQNTITKNIRYVCEYHYGKDKKDWCKACKEKWGE
jgi:hypothetical protein